MSHSTHDKPESRGPARRIAEVVNCFNEHDLLTSASAIAFRLLFAMVPLMLFALALASYLDLGDLWRAGVAPEVAPFVSRAAFGFLNQTVEEVLAKRQALWLTSGALLALWEVSGAVRAVMGALNRVYRAERERSFSRRMLISLAIALSVGSCVLTGVLVLQFGFLGVLGLQGGGPTETLDYALRLLVCAALLLLSVGLLVRYAPTNRQPIGWVSFGSVLTVVVWLVVSLAFAWYLTSVAPYTTAFGGLASVIVLMSFLYVSAIAFLLGVQLDAIVREEVSGAQPG